MTSVSTAFMLLPKDYAWTTLVASSTCATAFRDLAPLPNCQLTRTLILFLSLLLSSLAAPLPGYAGLQASQGFGNQVPSV